MSRTILLKALLIAVLFVGAVLASSPAMGTRNIRCDARQGIVHKYEINSAVEMIEGSDNEGVIRGRNNATRIKSTINLACDDDQVRWTDENGRQHEGQMWRIELTEISTTLACPSSRDGWEGDSCSSDYSETERWADGQNVAYYAVDMREGLIFWDPHQKHVQDTESCQAMRSTLIQLQSALRGDVPENTDETSATADRPKRRVTQHSSFSEGTVQKSNRFENVYRPSQMFEIPGMTVSGVSTISLVETVRRSGSGFRSHVARGMNTKGLKRIDSEEAACPVPEGYVKALLREQYGCDDRLLDAMKHVMSSEHQKSNMGTGPHHRLVSLCLRNEDREERKQELLDWLLKQEGAATTVMGIEILRRIGTEKSQSILAEIIVRNGVEKPWLSNVALFQATELDRVSEELLSVIEGLTSPFTVINNAAVSGNAWLALASFEYERLSNKDILPRPTKISKDPSVLRTLPTHLLIDVLNNAGSAIPASELKRIVYDTSVDMELRVRAASSVRRMFPADKDANDFVHQMISDSNLPIPVRMGALKGQKSRDKTAEFLGVIASDPMQPRAVRIEAERMLMPRPAPMDARCDPYAPSSVDITPQYLQYNISTGRCHASLGNDKFGASGSIFAFGGLSYTGCKDTETRSFKYALLGESLLEAHAFGDQFILLDFDLRQTGESVSHDYEDYLRLIVTNQVWYDGSLFPDHCYKFEKEIFRSGLKRLFGTSLQFVILGVPVAIEVEVQGGLVVRVDGEVCPVQLYTRAGVEPMAAMDISGSLGVGIKKLNGGVEIGGDTVMGLHLTANATAAECPHLAICSKLDAVIDSPLARVLGYIRILKKKWTKTLYQYRKNHVEKTPLYDKCFRL